MRVAYCTPCLHIFHLMSVLESVTDVRIGSGINSSGQPAGKGDSDKKSADESLSRNALVVARWGLFDRQRAVECSTAEPMRVGGRNVRETLQACFCRMPDWFYGKKTVCQGQMVRILVFGRQNIICLSSKSFYFECSSASAVLSLPVLLRYSPSGGRTAW